LRHIFFRDFEHRGERRVKEPLPETDRMEVPKTSLDQVECLYNNQVGRDQWNVVGADKSYRGGMMAVRPIDKGEISGGVDKDEAWSRVIGHGGNRRAPDGGSR
jgi:hypothetical protein